MEKERAVKLIILDIKTNEEFFNAPIYDYEGDRIDLTPFLKKYLSLMYVVGYDAGRTAVYKRYSAKKTPVIKYNKFGIKLAEYESVAQAAKENGISKDPIFESIRYKRLTLQGFYWKRKNLETVTDSSQKENNLPSEVVPPTQTDKL